MRTTYTNEQKNFVIDELTKFFTSTKYTLENINITNSSTKYTLYVKASVGNMSVLDRSNILQEFARVHNSKVSTSTSLSTAGHVEFTDGSTNYKIAFKLTNAYRNIDITDIIEFSQVLLHEYLKDKTLTQSAEVLFEELRKYSTKELFASLVNRKLLAKNKSGKLCHENIITTMFETCTPAKLNALNTAITLYKYIHSKYSDIDSVRWCANETGYDLTADIELILSDRSIVPISIKNYDLRDEIKLKSLAWYHLQPNMNHYLSNYKFCNSATFSKSSAIASVNLQNDSVIDTIRTMIYAPKPNKYMANEIIQDLLVLNVFEETVTDLTDILRKASTDDLSVLQVSSNKIKFSSNNALFSLIVDADKTINYLLHVKI